MIKKCFKTDLSSYNPRIYISKDPRKRVLCLTSVTGQNTNMQDDVGDDFNQQALRKFSEAAQEKGC